MSDEQIRKAAQVAHAEEFILNFPNQYDEILQTKGEIFPGDKNSAYVLPELLWETHLF